MLPPGPSYPTIVSAGYPNDSEIQDNLESNLIYMIGAFKGKMNKFLEEMKQNTSKRMEANKRKEIQEKVIKLVKRINKTERNRKYRNKHH